jgi:hypothetical protein
MKNLRLVINLLIVISLISCAPTKVAVNFDAPIIKMYDVEGTQDDLYVKANRWMITSFKDARSIIQFSDKEQGILIGRYLLRISPYDPYVSEEPIYAIIEITVKDEKARISIKPDNYSYLKANAGTAYWNKTHDSILYSKEMAIAEIEALCEDFNRSLKVAEPEF